MRSGADYLRSMPQSSYCDKQNRPTAALYRARQPLSTVPASLTLRRISWPDWLF